MRTSSNPVPGAWPVGLVVLLMGAPHPLQDPGEIVAPLVATHYFYWYRWPDEHFLSVASGQGEGHHHHFLDSEHVSYLEPGWHEREFRAMAVCGIDVALPVYWGTPGAYDRPGLRFARQGLAPMVSALDALAGRGEPGVKLGLFYDTTTLLRTVRGLPTSGVEPDRPDLADEVGKRLFCDTVVEYFEQIPGRHWARFEGRPLVVLYSSGFAGRWDETLGPALGKAFAGRFDGERPWLVADESWGDIGQDMTTAWGAALSGPKLLPGVAQIGPGYDDSPVPGRHTPRRDREQGRFYRWSWRAAVESAPRLVLIETWNEMHEGTEICETRETGRLYLDLTREWTARLARGDAGPEIAPPGPLHPRPDTSWGESAAAAQLVRVDYRERSVRRAGLREIPLEDGPCDVIDGALCTRGKEGHGVTYLYFAVSDHWRFDTDQRAEVRVLREGGAVVWLEYDSHDPQTTLEGSYKALQPGRVERTDQGVLEVYELPDARLANRQNGGADFRLVVQGGGARILAVEVR